MATHSTEAENRRISLTAMTAHVCGLYPALSHPIDFAPAVDTALSDTALVLLDGHRAPAVVPVPHESPLPHGHKLVASTATTTVWLPRRSQA